MKIFDQVEPWPDKVNFIDENNIVLGYDLSQQCCEYAYWIITDEIITRVPKPSELPKYNKDFDIENWIFDPSFYKGIEITAGENYKELYDDEYYGDGIASVFRIAKGNEEKFIILYNIQNGYYSHGFEFSQNNNIILKGSL